MKDITDKLINEIGVDRNFAASFIKAIVWLISWTAGILLPFQKGVDTGFDNTQVMFGSTCVVFCLSLLVEFLPMTFSQFKKCSRCYYAFFCLNLSWIICISFYAMIKENIGRGCLIALFVGTVVAIAMIAIGFIIPAFFYLGIIKPKEEKTNEKESMPDEMSPQKVFEQTLESGALGTTLEVIEGGGNG